MKPARRDLEGTQGDDFTHTFEFRSNGEGLDISDWDLVAQVRLEPGGEVIATFTFDRVDEADGRVHMELAKAVTAALAVRAYRYDLERTLEGLTRTMIRGAFRVNAQITAED